MIAYFILVHRYPEQFKRLFSAIYDPANHYLIHIDKKSDPDLYENIALYVKPYANVHFLKSQNVVWGGYSMVDVEMKAIKKLLLISSDWQYYINLSGQDFPLQSQAQILRFLKKNGKSSYIKVADQRKERPNTLNRIENYFTETANGFVGKPLKRAYLKKTIPYIGGQWKILSRACCAFLCTSRKVAKYEKYYANTLIPDESFFQTVLLNSGFIGKIVNDDKRAIIWIPDMGPELLSKNFSLNTTQALVDSGEIKLRPKTLTVHDLPYLKKSGALFGRKFDATIDVEILSVLESSIGSGQKLSTALTPMAETGWSTYPTPFQLELAT